MKKLSFRMFGAASPLSKKLALSIILYSSIVAVFVTFIQLFYDYQRDIDDVNLTFDNIEKSYHGITATALWHVDLEAVQKIYHGLEALPTIDHVKITFAEGSVTGKDPPQSAYIAVHTINLYYPHDGQARYVGELTLGSDISRIYRNLGKKLLLILCAQGAKTFLMAIIMLFIFERLIMQHLRSIAAYARQMRIENNKMLPPSWTLSNDVQGELKDVVQALNEMRLNIGRSYEELERAEHQLRVLNASLEKEVQKRIQENEKQQMLIQHSARLSSLGEMASSIAHEINNPLTIIAGYIRIIRQHLKSEHLSPEKLESFGEKAENTVRRITAIISGLLRLSRVDPANGLLNYAINEILWDTASICREKFASRGIKFDVEIPSINICTACRPAEIGQIALNLLNNAFDAVKNMPDPWIALTLYEQDGKAVVAVSDSGPGIPEAIRERIKEPFFTTKPYGQGTGLGLSISHAIASEHDGRLYLDEQSPHTRFVVELPVIACQTPIGRPS
ncbi:MAG: ATP-binding protein [Pseudobdellovibrionaceae bacterium]|nr:ATP-binding protein [Pseudobdellovibrionaceae bacterium]